MFQTVPLSINRSFSLYTQQWYMSYRLWAGSGWILILLAVSKAVWHIPMLCVQWKTPDDGQRNCLKHVEFYSKNKFEKLVHLIGFIIRIYHDARSLECQMYSVVNNTLFYSKLELCLIMLLWVEISHSMGNVECMLLFGAESSLIQVAVQKFKNQDI